MKAFLMYRDQDFDLERRLPANVPDLTQDLELEALFEAMASGDGFFFDVARQAVFSSVTDADTIRYRQDVLKDCLKNPSIIRHMYALVTGVLDARRKHFWGLTSRYPSSILYDSVGLLGLYMDMLKQLKAVADAEAHKFTSEGFTTFFAMLRKELADEYFAVVQDHLRELQFRGGVLISAQLTRGNVGDDYTLRKPWNRRQAWYKRIFSQKLPGYTFYIADRDEAGARALRELKDRGINLAANALAQSADHVLSFVEMLRRELAFYIGCMNLHDQLTEIGEPTCFPVPAASGQRLHSYDGLYDVCLALTMKRALVGNAGNAGGKDLVMITGANQGGKSTFLRSVGVAQLMMQCGMFAPAHSLSANVCDGLFTHKKKRGCHDEER